MKTEVLLERLPDKRYRAKGSGRFALTVDGDTREDALNNFREAAVALVPKDAEIVEIDIPIRSDAPKDDPWASFAGWLKDDPWLPLYLEAIAENRRIDEENENRKMAEEEALAEAAKKASRK